MLITLMACIIPNFAIAKDGKVKYAKTIEYKGAVSNKNPNGVGTLTVYSRVNGKQPLLTVSGIFENDLNNANEFSISDANISVTDGVKITAQTISVSLNVAKDEESIKFDIPICKIAEVKNVISLTENLSLSLNWTKKGDKQWKYSVNAPTTGVLYENLLPITDIQARIDARDEEPIKQTVYFMIRYNPGNPEAPAAIDLLNVKDIDFNSGLKVACNKYSTEYSFPNGDYANYGTNGRCSKLKLTLPDGQISFDGSKAKVSYSNGDRFETKDLSGFWVIDHKILNLQSLDSLHRNTGIYYMADGKELTYRNNQIVGKKINDGSISMDDNSIYAIRYDNGYTFTGANRNFIKNPNDFPNFSSVNEAEINTGRLIKSSEVWDSYENGIVVGGRWPLSDGGYVEYANKIPVSVKYADGSCASGTFQENQQYNANLKSSDFELKDGKVTYANEKSLIYNNGNPKLSNVEDIIWYASLKGLEAEVIEIKEWKCNLSLETYSKNIKLKQSPMAKQINNTDYYLQIAPGLCLSYPKSFVTKGYNYFDEPLIVAETCDVNITKKIDDDPGNSSYNKSYMVWMYKPVIERDGVKYGITKGLYVIEKDWHHEIGNLQDKILYDVSETFKVGHNRDFKKVYPAPKKKTYHKHGRVENCGICFGTGKGWRGGYCPFCGGKGWYIEHEW